MLGFYTYINNKSRPETSRKAACFAVVLFVAQRLLSDLLSRKAAQWGFFIPDRVFYLRPYAQSLIRIETSGLQIEMDQINVLIHLQQMPSYILDRSDRD